MDCRQCPAYEYLPAISEHRCRITGAQIPPEDLEADFPCPANWDFDHLRDRLAARSTVRLARARGTLDLLQQVLGLRRWSELQDELRRPLKRQSVSGKVRRRPEGNRGLLKEGIYGGEAAEHSGAQQAR